MKLSIADAAAKLPDIWLSGVPGTVGNASIKLIRMGGEGIAPEVHPDFDELLLVDVAETARRVENPPL